MSKPILLSGIALLACACTELAGADGPPAGAPAPYLIASAPAPVGALCDLYPQGATDPAARVRIAADDDGVARFQARRATPESEVQALTIECVDPSGRRSLGTVDLAADETFAARPYDRSRAGGAERPPLAGDPMSYSQAELIQKGYGLRPDPASSPDAYARWREAASVSVHLVGGNGPTAAQTAALVRLPGSRATAAAAPAPARTALVTGVVQLPAPRVQTGTNSIWAGSVLEGYYGVTPASAGLVSGSGTGAYVAVEAQFNVPPVTAGLYGTSNSTAHASIWAGLGGFGYSNALIQGGINVHVDSNVVSYSIMREFCCGLTGTGLGAPQLFSVLPNAKIYTQEWYCDASGNPSMTGGYGCSYIVEWVGDVSTRAVNCVSPTDTTCRSLPFGAGWVSGGESADFVIEQQDPTFPGFAAPVLMSGTTQVAFGGGVVDLNDASKVVTSNVDVDPKVLLESTPSYDGVTVTPSISAPAAKTTELHTSSVPVLLVVENKCVNAAPISGAAATIVTCSASASQQWVFHENGTITPANVPSLCLDLSGGNTANGTAVGLYTCNGGANQKWTFTGSQLTGLGGKCLDDPNFVTTDGTRFDYWTCNGGANQTVAITSTPRTLVAEGSTSDNSGYTGNPKCIDLPNWKTADGTRLDLWDCNGGTNQKWTLGSDGTVRTIVDMSKCVDLDGTAQGSHVQLHGCTGASTQRWSEAWGWGDGTMFTGAGGLVIDDPNSILTNGTQLDYWAAHGTGDDAHSANQAFKIE